MTICPDPALIGVVVARSAPPGTAQPGPFPHFRSAPGRNEAATSVIPLNPALLRRTRSMMRAPACASGHRRTLFPAFGRERKGRIACRDNFARREWLSCNKSAKGPAMSDDFSPKFDARGLLTAIAVDAADGDILMVAFMDAEALAATRATGFAHFHSRSRGRLWMKGETSGHTLSVEEIQVDCDQDALILRCRPAGPACHTGARTCFFRRLDGDKLVKEHRHE